MTLHEVEALILGLSGGSWLFRVLVIPLASCRWCGGSGNNPFSTGRRRGRCWFCHGTRERMVLGAKTVHSAIRHLRTSRNNGWRK